MAVIITYIKCRPNIYSWVVHTCESVYIWKWYIVYALYSFIGKNTKQTIVYVYCEGIVLRGGVELHCSLYAWDIGLAFTIYISVLAQYLRACKASEDDERTLMKERLASFIRTQILNVFFKLIGFIYLLERA